MLQTSCLTSALGVFQMVLSDVTLSVLLRYMFLNFCGLGPMQLML